MHIDSLPISPTSPSWLSHGISDDVLKTDSSYFWISGIYSLIYALTGRSPLRRYPRFLQFLHSIFYSTITTYPFIVTAVYWALISSPPHTKALGTIAARWSNISFHCLNAVFAFFEVVFSAVLPQRWTHSFFILLFLGLYISMAYIIHATSKFYVYEFMDTKSMGALTGAYIAGIGGLGIVTFFVVQGIVWLKQWCCGRRVWKSKYDIPRWPLEQRMSECSTQLEKGYGVQARRSW